MYYIVYKTSNLINGKFYIGTHKTEDLNDAYMGSGKLLIRAIEKYGLENFKKEILHVFDNPDDMFAKEAEIVSEDFLVEENTYNLKVGGFGGFDFVNKNPIVNSERGKKGRKAVDNLLFEKYGVDNPSQIPFVAAKISQAFKDLHKKGLLPKASFKGKSHKKETKDKISAKLSIAQTGSKNSQFGTIWITNGSENKKIKKTDLVPNGWFLGRKI